MVLFLFLKNASGKFQNFEPHSFRAWRKRFSVLANGLLIYNLKILVLPTKSLVDSTKFCWDSKKNCKLYTNIPFTNRANL